MNEDQSARGTKTGGAVEKQVAADVYLDMVVARCADLFYLQSHFDGNARRLLAMGTNEWGSRPGRLWFLRSLRVRNGSNSLHCVVRGPGDALNFITASAAQWGGVAMDFAGWMVSPFYEGNNNCWCCIGVDEGMAVKAFEPTCFDDLGSEDAQRLGSASAVNVLLSGLPEAARSRPWVFSFNFMRGDGGLVPVRALVNQLPPGCSAAGLGRNGKKLSDMIDAIEAGNQGRE